METTKKDKIVIGTFMSLSLTFIFMASVAYSNPQRYTLGFFVPHAQNPWWTIAVNIMRAACNDLNMELQVYHAHNSRETMRQQIKEAVSGPNKIDALIFQSFKQAGESFIQIAETAKVPAFLFNAGVDHHQTGPPRGKYKYWIGEMLPDDEGAGFDLANYLIETAIKAGKRDANGKVQMLGINGVVSDGAAIERSKGLRRAIQGRTDVHLLRVIPGDWGFDSAQEKFTLMMRRFPQTAVVWAANDNMALGVIAGGREMNLKMGKDIIVGGIDWEKKALHSVQSEEMAVTIGGHFLEAAWVTVLLYDYLHGIDFEQESVMMKSKMHLLSRDSVDTYLKKLGKGDWEKVDFTMFSKKLNPHLKQYQFTLEAILAQL